MKKPNLNLKRASVLTSTLLCSALLIAAPLRRELNEGWKFKQARLNNWYPATVPGVVHTDLMDNKIIEDPFFRLTPEMMERQNIELVFKGLDTYADVYLNEKKILETNNMFRIWGGGIYEEDVFYELCDRYGILVWQDFMFACSLYPAEGELLENIRQEAIDYVKRFRNHACIALWCSNNECNDAWFNWG